MKSDEAYKKAIETATPLGLVIINYNLLLKYIHLSKRHCESEEREEFKETIKKAREFLNLLMSTLDMDYEVSKHMMSLYLYANKLLIQAEISFRYDIICEACDILGSLLDCFKLITKSDIEKELIEQHYLEQFQN